MLIVSLILIGGIDSVFAVNEPSPSTENQLILSLPNTLEDSQNATTLPEYVVIQPSEQVTFSSETSASVGAISIKEGSNFHRGDVLLELDCRIQDAELKKAKAEQSVSDFALASAKKLKSYHSISELEYRQAESQKHISDAEVDKLIAIVEKCTLKAPFNGSVARLMVHMHESVKPGDPLLKIVSTDNLDFVLQVPSNWLEWLHVDSVIRVHVNEIGKTVETKITKISPEIDSVSQTVKIFANQTTPDPSLRPGMSGQASFPDRPISIAPLKPNTLIKGK